MNEIVLASASKYRKELLSRLGFPFICQSPLFDEEKHKDPSLAPQTLAEKLALLKARSLAGPGKTVIGGDQLVALGSKILGKPHNVERAQAQLCEMQGQTHQLITAVCVIAEGKEIPFVNVTKLTMKKLSQSQIARYVELDQPLDCAGSYKIELHGISLFEKIESNDFTAIQGLPLLQLSQVLHNLGYGTLGL